MIAGYEKVHGNQISRGDVLISGYRVADVMFTGGTDARRSSFAYVLMLEKDGERPHEHKIRPRDTAWIEDKQLNGRKT